MAGQMRAEQWTHEVGVTKGFPDDNSPPAPHAELKVQTAGVVNGLFIRLCSVKPLARARQPRELEQGHLAAGLDPYPQALEGDPSQTPEHLPRVWERCRASGECHWRGALGPGPQPGESAGPGRRAGPRCGPTRAPGA
uniref:Uncharacterized protein n=1 Tax=Molossus molossus TaxID=27622 RepID=A0A7J8C8G4_MOLMO|nr:hypothetical protein HJG59_009854 [Molossus molossus]